ncbi:MAG TPA: hypothetical protein VMU04_08400 [Candidatus Acidoferrum sp.]|nr:hypothetical protein [Candidatus Acidoferrum sp.]
MTPCINPVRGGLLKPEERLLAYPWSSLGACLAAPEHRPCWVRVDRLLGEHGIQQDTPGARQQFEQRMETRRQEETGPEALQALRCGWYLGSDAFKRQLLQRMEGSLGGHHAGELHRQAADARAERIIAEELQRKGWSEQELQARRKNDPAKLDIAARLRKETTLSIKAIAARVHLGTSKAANMTLHHHLNGSLVHDAAQVQLGL